MTERMDVADIAMNMATLKFEKLTPIPNTQERIPPYRKMVLSKASIIGLFSAVIFLFDIMSY